jgi:putative ABC transport system substrate-binding protein
MLEVRRPNDFGNAFQAIIRERAQGVLVLADPMTFTHRSRLTDFAVQHRLPLMGGPRGYTEAGGLMSYWADESDLGRRAASYVDRVLKGASPERLPIEQPTKYELMVNLKTAKALALTIPPSLLLQATVIE